jgi:hypothetical protein
MPHVVIFVDFALWLDENEDETSDDNDKSK